MEPAFQRGDVLFLDNNMNDVEVGDVVVYKIKDRDIPIVHRVLSVYQRWVLWLCEETWWLHPVLSEFVPATPRGGRPALDVDGMRVWCPQSPRRRTTNVDKR
jgi:signal peptidase I